MQLTGVYAPIPTPFDGDGQVDLTRLRKALPFWIGSALTGLVVLGTTGEAGLLSDDESARVIDTVRQQTPRDRTLIAGTARESTTHAIAAARQAASIGADAVLVRTPCFFKGLMTGDAFERHYRAVADASPVPVLLYNFTAATGDFTVLAGSASTLHAAMCAGVRGAILALAAVVPEPCVQLFRLAREGKHAEARALQRRLIPLARLISTGHGVPGLKAALLAAGVDAGLPRLPLAPAPDAAVASIHAALHSLEDAFA